jgi:hypothetical protein
MHRRRSRGTFALAAALIALAAASSAQAMSFELDGPRIRSNGGGLLTPCIRVALDAMASERGIEQRFDTDEAGRPVISALNRNNAFFSLTLTVANEATGEPLRLLPPGPCRQASCMDRDYINLVAIAADGTPLLVRATVSSPDGRLDPTSIYGFNP